MPRLDEIVARLGGKVVGNGAVEIDGAGTLSSAQSGQIAFLSNPRYRAQLATTHAGAVVLGREVAAECPVAAIVADNPYLYFARISQWLHPLRRPPSGVAATAVVESVVPASCSIGAGSWLGADVRLGENVAVGANCSIGAGAQIGAGSFLYPNVVIQAGCRIGERAIVHSGAVIGADGFGFAQNENQAWEKIPQVGGVTIGDDVEIGANTTIDRGALEDTVIEDGVKLDNQIQVAHNVRIGAHSALAGCVGIAGSARIGRRCQIGGGAIILGHIEIADDVFVSAGTLVAKSIAKPGSYTGTVPFMPHAEWLNNFSRLRHLDSMADRIRALEARLAALEQGKRS